MNIVAAYLLVSSGKSQPTKEKVVSVLKSVQGINFEQERVDEFFKAIEGKNVEEVIQAGLKKVQSFGGGGSAAAAPSGNATTAAPKEEPKKEEPAQQDETDDAMEGFGLFD